MYILFIIFYRDDFKNNATHLQNVQPQKAIFVQNVMDTL